MQHITFLGPIAAILVVLSSLAQAAGVSGEVEEIFVTGTTARNILVQDVEAASVGTVLAHQLEHRPILRPAEILETIPGMVITQHSGGGKANQYFLRGFNLDHSTDFASFFEGAPVNMVSHGHGQGYSDLNFLIPEMVERMVYKKGPYYASEGDFSSVGSAHIFYKSMGEKNRVKLTAGEDGYLRGLLSGGFNGVGGQWVYALSRTENDGPWSNPDELERDKAFVKYTAGDSSTGFSISGMYFDSTWNGTDQIPQRLVSDGSLDRYGSLDQQTGGTTHRYQLASQLWFDVDEHSRVKANAYVVDYELSLTGNFTYYVGDIAPLSLVPGVEPTVLSDQVTQFDDRQIAGGAFSWEIDLSESHDLEIGASIRHDNISEVGVGSSFDRKIYALSSSAAVEETGAGLYASVHSQWNDWLASIVGLRYDTFFVDVDNELNTADSGSEDDQLVAPKFSLRLGPFRASEFFINYGRGFHSNDARGVVAGEVPLLSESEGYELGYRNTSIDGLQLSVVLFQLELDSELVFIGDDGTTEPKEASRRQGFEISAYYEPNDWLVLDADYTSSKARFKSGQFDGEEYLGKYVPDSIEDVVSMGVSADRGGLLHGGLRLRYFGPRNLTESGEIKSSSSLMLNANLGVEFKSGFAANLEILNLTDEDDDDITYWYASRTRLERDAGSAPVEDFHSHPMIPRTLRMTIRFDF